jgi:hypothetical protein
VPFDYGFLAKLTIADVTAKYDIWNIAARVYPWGRTFFVGAIYGHYGIDGPRRTALEPARRM